ncbi:carbohydrate esterase family 4 protein [Boletus coccyginus]|nr:carbohydrate esterase family 4 protein [Boletus coccyginus]
MRLSSLPISLLALTLAAILGPTASAQNHTTEQGQAQITDPNEECALYNYPPVSDAIVAGKFPPTWSPASILANDASALAKYQSIQSEILNTSKPVSDLLIVPEPDTLGYGFDDGPSCSHNVFYNFLQENNQTATMFYIGSSIVSYPLQAQRALADGHEICVRKCPPFLLSPRPLTPPKTLGLTIIVFAELYYTVCAPPLRPMMQIIKLVIGVTPTCWRPPYGDVDDRVRAIAQALGLRNIMWSYDSGDWHAGSDNAYVDTNYQALVTAAQKGTFNTGGTILLAHELSNATMSEAIKWYPQLMDAFEYLVPIGVAMNVTHPYVETEYLLPTFEQYIAGTTTLATSAIPSATSLSPQATSTSSSGSSTPQSQTTSGARASFGAPSGLAVLAAFVGIMLM